MLHFNLKSRRVYSELLHVTAEVVAAHFDCLYADIDPDGSIWIAGPMRGHYLRAVELSTLAEYVLLRDHALRLHRH